MTGGIGLGKVTGGSTGSAGLSGIVILSQLKSYPPSSNLRHCFNALSAASS